MRIAWFDPPVITRRPSGVYANTVGPGGSASRISKEATENLGMRLTSRPATRADGVGAHDGASGIRNRIVRGIAKAQCRAERRRVDARKGFNPIGLGLRASLSYFIYYIVCRSSCAFELSTYLIDLRPPL